uniref:Uncharacterized protein n=1 Tax=Myotis myotis TaxID=51298 RepID=A0A7J7VYS2_MYOMY|nr:hypothetical protein mMyoMyo1_012213 [Myotis myotis]
MPHTGDQACNLGIDLTRNRMVTSWFIGRCSTTEPPSRASSFFRIPSGIVFSRRSLCSPWEGQVLSDLIYQTHDLSALVPLLASLVSMHRLQPPTSAQTRYVVFIFKFPCFAHIRCSSILVRWSSHYL